MTSTFKFTKRRYAQTAVERGQFRLSHVAGFRVSDGISGGRSDTAELTSSADILGGEETVLSDDPRLGGMFTYKKNGVAVPTEMVVSGASIELLDSGLLFCTSLDNSDDTFNRMRADFGAEAAYEITDVDEFAQRIQLHLAETEPHLEEAKSRVKRHLDMPHPMREFDEAMGRYLKWEMERQRPFVVDCGPVTYYDESRAGSISAMPPVDPFPKGKSYEWQREHRIVVRPYDIAGDLDIELPSLCSLLRLVR